MLIIQTIEKVWRINEVALAEHAAPEYQDWIDNGGKQDDFAGFVEASVKELGTEVFGLELVDTFKNFNFVGEDN